MMSNVVTCEKTKNQVIFILNNFWNCNYTDFVFPLPNFVYLERKHLKSIKNGEYVYTIKNINHKRAVFMLYKNHEDINKQYLIFRDNTIIETSITFNDYLYKGSIFDVTYDSENIYIYDTYMIGGYIVNYCEYNVRHDYASSICKDINSVTSCKKYSSVSEITSMKDDEELYFIPNEKPLNSGLNYYSFRWRPSELIEIGLKVKENEENLDLYTTNFKTDKLFARISSDTEKIKNLEYYKDGCIVNFNIKKVEFEAESVKTDQEYPTNIRHIEKIILFKRENITFLELSN